MDFPRSGGIHPPRTRARRARARAMRAQRVFAPQPSMHGPEKLFKRLQSASLKKGSRARCVRVRVCARARAGPSVRVCLRKSVSLICFKPRALNRSQTFEEVECKHSYSFLGPYINSCGVLNRGPRPGSRARPQRMEAMRREQAARRRQ